MGRMDHQNDTGPVLVQSVSKNASVYGRVQANDRCSLSLRALLVQKYKYGRSRRCLALLALLVQIVQMLTQQRRCRLCLVNGGEVHSLPVFTTQFACLAGTKVQKLTQQALQVDSLPIRFVHALIDGQVSACFVSICTFVPVKQVKRWARCLSALIDGQVRACSACRLYSYFCTSKASKQRWTRCLSGSCMR